jgi:hypothetical protein
MRDVYVVNDFAGAQTGTKDNPYVARGAREFDRLMSSLVAEDDLAHHWTGRFGTRGAYRWGAYADANWRAGRNWSIEGDFTLSIDPDAIPDDEIDSQPLFCIASRNDAVAPRVKGGTLIGNHSVLAERWRAQGKTLRTGGPLLYGDARLDSVTVRDCGSLGAESFVAEIVGTGAIVGCTYTDHDPSASDDQVTVFRVIGSENCEWMSGTPCLMERNTTNTPASKLVQAHCVYSCPGVVRNNKSVGAQVFYYGDYCGTRDVTIEENEADDCEHGVQLKLSPTPLPFAERFFHERYTIGPNRFRSSGANVSLDTCGPPTPTRFIRDIKVDSSLSLENFGATNVTRITVPQRRGCNPFAFLRR